MSPNQCTYGDTGDCPPQLYRTCIMKIRPFIWTLLALCCCNSLKDNPAELTALQEKLEWLEAGIRNAEAVRAVKRLQHAYGHYSEMGLWHDFADLFADSGIGHYPHGDLGKESIRRLFLEEVGGGKLGLDKGRLYIHFMMEPVVTLSPDGKSARGRWRILAMMGSYGKSAFWAGGVYENAYIFEDGFWKIQDLKYYASYSGRYEEPGWTVQNESAPFHYDPRGAGNPFPAFGNGLQPGSTSLSLSGLNRKLEELTGRVQRIYDEDSITNLQNIYGYYVDRKMWDDVADLFADDAEMRLERRGIYIGRKSIRNALSQFGPQGLRRGEINEHLQLQVIVTVAEDRLTAKARGVELILSGVAGESGLLGENIFENEYVQQHGVWKIQSMRLYPRFRTDNEKGWAKDAAVPPGPSREFPPDRMPASDYKSFPGFEIPPFHFPNPATGRPPRYPDGTAADTRLPTGVPSDRSSKASRNAATTLEELSNRVAGTERLLKICNAYSASENISSAYGYYLDEALWDETADLFTIDARRDLSTIGIETGRETIRESLKRRYPGGKSMGFFTAHQLIQPVIHVAPDGEGAKMRVRLFQLGGASGKSGFWLAGMYETTTAPEEGAWKFQSMDLDYTWTAAYSSGWARVDGNTRGIISTPFPEITDLPFHYRNPVTGRIPPLFVP